KAAAVTSTVLTVGECRAQAKLQKEHALGHSCNCFCFCGCLVLCSRGAIRPRGLEVKSRAAGEPATTETHKHTNLVNYVCRHHEVQIFKPDPLQLAQQCPVHPLSRRRVGSTSARRPGSL